MLWRIQETLLSFLLDMYSMLVVTVELASLIQRCNAQRVSIHTNFYASSYLGPDLYSSDPTITMTNS
jgi:hypothetical protein